jgi:hypothetical protein
VNCRLGAQRVVYRFGPRGYPARVSATSDTRRFDSSLYQARPEMQNLTRTFDAASFCLVKLCG